jgi:hypothetical protein
MHLNISFTLLATLKSFFCSDSLYRVLTQHNNYIVNLETKWISNYKFKTLKTPSISINLHFHLENSLNLRNYAVHAYVFFMSALFQEKFIIKLVVLNRAYCFSGQQVADSRTTDLEKVKRSVHCAATWW